MIVFRTGWGNELIKEVEATRKNEKSVWTKNSWNDKETRSARSSSCHNYWDTLEEAKNHLKDKYDRDISSAENKITVAKANLRQLSEY